MSQVFENEIDPFAEGHYNKYGWNFPNKAYNKSKLSVGFLFLPLGVAPKDSFIYLGIKICQFVNCSQFRMTGGTLNQDNELSSHNPFLLLFVQFYLRILQKKDASVVANYSVLQ